MEMPLALAVVGAVEDEVLPYLDLMKMVQLVDLVRFVNPVVCFHPKSTRTHFELAQGHTKSMHLMVECVVGANNETIPQIHEVLSIESHL